MVEEAAKKQQKVALAQVQSASKAMRDAKGAESPEQVVGETAALPFVRVPVLGVPFGALPPPPLLCLCFTLRSSCASACTRTAMAVSVPAPSGNATRALAFIVCLQKKQKAEASQMVRCCSAVEKLVKVSEG